MKELLCVMCNVGSESGTQEMCQVETHEEISRDRDLVFINHLLP